jgi:hypothetical protein
MSPVASRRRGVIFDDSSWKTAFIGGSHEFLIDGVRMLNYRSLMHYVATGITPAMTHAAPGVGSQYAHTVDDANGDTLDGAKAHTLTLPAPVPVKTFWASGGQLMGHDDPRTISIYTVAHAEDLFAAIADVGAL